MAMYRALRGAAQHIDLIDTFENRALREQLRAFAQDADDEVANKAVPVLAFESQREWHCRRCGAMHLRQRTVQRNQIAESRLREWLALLAHRLACNRPGALVVVRQHVKRLAL